MLARSWTSGDEVKTCLLRLAQQKALISGSRACGTEHYWPDSATSLRLRQSRLIANGYQMPPAGPELDGIMIELTPPDADKMTGE